MFGIERSIDTLYLKRSGSCSVADSEGFGEYFCFIMCESGNSISAVGEWITWNGIRESSDYLSNEDISRSGTLSCSVTISSEVGYVSSVCFGEIDSCSDNGFFNGYFVFIGENSDFISSDIYESVLIIYGIYTIRVIGIGLVYKTPDDVIVRYNLYTISRFEVSHQLGFFPVFVYGIGIFGCVFRVKGELVYIDDSGNTFSNIPLIREYHTVSRYFYGIFGKRIDSGLYLEKRESLMEGFKVGYSHTISRAFIKVLDGDNTDGSEDNEYGDSNDEFDEGETTEFSDFVCFIF